MQNLKAPNNQCSTKKTLTSDKKRQSGEKRRKLRKTHSSRSMELRLLLSKVDVSCETKNKKYPPTTNH